MKSHETSTANRDTIENCPYRHSDFCPNLSLCSTAVKIRRLQPACIWFHKGQEPRNWKYQYGNNTTYYMASSVSGQDEPNRAL